MDAYIDRAAQKFMSDSCDVASASERISNGACVHWPRQHLSDMCLGWKLHNSTCTAGVEVGANDPLASCLVAMFHACFQDTLL